jgi:carbon monoxide dehydrogenase subunit G
VRVDGERQLGAPRDVVWEILNDPKEMAALMPGVQSFELQDERHWRASVKIPLGLGSLAMTINFEKTEERPPDFASLRAKGQGVGAMLNMETSFTIEPAESGTRMLWAANVSIAGPVGSMGQRVLQPIVKQQVNMVLTALDKRVVAVAGGAGDAGDAAVPSAPQQ